MRRQIIRAASLAIVLLCLCATVSEIFDTWDNTLETGNDIEFTIIVLALCTGATFIVVKLIFPVFPASIFHSHSLQSPQSRWRPDYSAKSSFIQISPSPPPLRV